MKKFAQLAFASGAALALAACGSSDDASSEAEAESVEMPAEDALAGVEEEPVADDGAMSEAEAPAPVTVEEATTAADDAEDVIAAAEAAAAAAGQ